MDKIEEYYSKIIDLDRLLIFGCGGHARSVANSILAVNPSIKLLFVDDNAKNNEKIMGFDVVKEFQYHDEEFFVAIGDSFKRSDLTNKLILSLNKKPISIISKNCIIGIDVSLEYGCFLGFDTYIGPCSRVSENVIINTGCIIEHEVIIGDNSTISPNSTICGRTKIGNNCFVGAGTVIIDGINVCSDVIVGANSTVVDDICTAGTYIGSPARIKKVLECER